MNCGSGGWPSVTPDSLNDAYKFGQFWVPAGALTPTGGFPANIEIHTSTEAANHWSWTVAKFAASVKNGACFSWGFKADFLKAPIADLKLRVAPIFFTKVSADDPANIVEWSIGAANQVVGDDINLDSNTETELFSAVQPTTTPAGKFLINAGSSVNKQAAPLTLVNVGFAAGEVSPISLTDWNLLTVNLEREGDHLADTFLGDVYLLGLDVQFAVDFNNVNEWPQT